MKRNNYCQLCLVLIPIHKVSYENQAYRLKESGISLPTWPDKLGWQSYKSLPKEGNS